MRVRIFKGRSNTLAAAQAADEMLSSKEDWMDEEDHEVESMSSMNQKCVQYIILHPEKSCFKTVWDDYIYFGLACNYILMPLTLAFDVVRIGDDRILAKTYLWEVLFDISFIFHILLNFITAYQHDLEWIVDPRSIALNYVRSLFIFDVISTLPALVMGQ
jgi:Ion transport protein